MRRFKLFVLLLTLFLVLGSSHSVFADESEKILEFKSDIVVNKDATIDIEENIIYQPGISDTRHGLLWQIPFQYLVKGFKRPTKVDIKSVEYHPLSDSDDVILNRYSRSVENGWLMLKIGDAEKYINEPHQYTIKYTLKYSGISYFDEHDEIYLNVIGPGWNIPIENPSATVKFPGKVLDTVCYIGPDGSTVQEGCVLTTDSESSISIGLDKRLEPFEGYTFATKLPKGSIENTLNEQFKLVILSNIGILLPIPLGIYLFFFLRRRYSNKKLTVIPYYEPEKDMDVLVSGILLKQRYNPKYITATLIELAVNGYLKIREYKKKKYEIVKREKDSDDLPTYFKSLYDAIFAHGDVVPLNKLTSFFTTANKVYLEGFSSLKERGLLSTKKINVKQTFIILSSIFTILPTFLGEIFFINAALGWLFGIVISAILLAIFSFTIDTRSETGNKKYHYLLGLKMYINTAEKKRIEFHNDPKKYVGIFEKYYLTQ